MKNKIGIHNGSIGFHPEWIKFCQDQNIAYKIVNAYSCNLIKDLEDCSAFMWHFSQNDPKDIIIAKQIMFALQHSGKAVFPDFYTMWHFDDKLGQKYLLESFDIPFVKSYCFYNKKEALQWIDTTSFPKVFKLRGGAGSANVRLVRSINEAKTLISKAFGSGFSNYSSFGLLKDKWRLYKLSKINFDTLLNSFLHLFIPPAYAKVMGRESGYVYFQDFISDNNFDIRVIVIKDKAFAIKRMVRKNDFRASGSGHILYEKENFQLKTIEIAFNAARLLKSQCLAFDFVFENEKPLIVEISYGFAKYGYVDCTGYWDKDLNWYEGKFSPYGWMVESVLR